jgi:putative tryptophan/tyrosine transport system substrate-binding protein
VHGLRIVGTTNACWLGMVLLAWILCEAVPAVGASPKVVIILSQDLPPYADLVKGFRAAVAGVDAQMEIGVQTLKGTDGNPSDILSQFKDSPPKAFVTVGSLATQVVLAEHKEVPVIASLTAHLEKLRKYENVTGVGLEFSLDSQFDAMRRILPELSTVGVLYNPKENQETIDHAVHIANKLSIKLVPKSVSTPRDIPDALESLANNVDLLWGITDQVVVSPQTAEPILLFSFRNKIPFAGLSTPWVKAGSLYALERDYSDIGSQCAEIAVKIVNKTAPHTIPVVAPRKVRFSLNLKTARTMQIDLPHPIIDEASQVVQ